MKDYTDESCREFIKVLASDRPAPGGGGAAAVVGAIGTALGHMVGSLTVGKKKYADAEDEMRELISKCCRLEAELLDQVTADEEGFMPLAAAYRLPKDTPDRNLIMEEGRLMAGRTPVHIMELCCEAIDTVSVFAEDGSRLAVSDAACAAVCLKAALEAASLNVYVNTCSLEDKKTAEAVNARCEEMLGKYGEICDSIYEKVRSSLLKNPEK